MGCALSLLQVALPCWAGPQRAYRDVVPGAKGASEGEAKGKAYGAKKDARGRASSNSTTLGGVDHDTDLWHGRESASKMVRRHSLDQEQAKGMKGSGMGIWQGVVFPCMANILGVLLFLRLPWIVGKAGILNGFFLVFICCCCTLVTALSLSAVATNGKIAGGGSYYLISRSLGPALGAGVGLCFYMANSIGAAMYFMGTVEAWEIAAPSAQIIGVGDLNNIRVTGFCILAVALAVVAGGIKYVARLGTVFLAIVMCVITFMYLGCLIGPGSDGSPYTIDVTDEHGVSSPTDFTWSGPSTKHFADNFGQDYDSVQRAFPLDHGKYDFISLMALWFPAVTGIMAGSNRSADLADPAGAIPRGTLFAQVFTSFIYLSFVVLYGCVAPRETLLDDKFFAASASWPLPELVIFGVMASTIGAGLTSLVSGTRLLSAIAADKTLPILRVFAVEPGKEPRLALVASGVLSACAIAIGELNAVAPVLTMFFLMCYTCVNMSCTILEAVNDPNWRPRFRYHHWSISLVGAILCVWMMFAISALTAMIAIVFCGVIFAYAAYNSHEVKWGDGFQGLKFQIARNILTRMDFKTHTKNWRPQLLVITGASIREEAEEGAAPTEVLEIFEPELLGFASQLKGGRGITIIGGVCSSKGVDVFGEGGMFVNQSQQRRVLDGQEAMRNLLHRYNIEGFGRVVYTENYSNGLLCLMQISGLGAFQPNCVLAAWPRDWREPGQKGLDARAHLIRMVQVAVVFQKVMLIAKGATWPQLTDRLQGSVDIWWIVGDGGILLLLPFLLQKHRVWYGCRTRLFVLAEKVVDDPEMMKRELETYVTDFRLNIEVFVQTIDLEKRDIELAPGEFDPEPVSRVVSSDTLTGTGDAGKWTRQISGASIGPQFRRMISGDGSTGPNDGQLKRTTSSDARAFPLNPPGTIGSTASPPTTLQATFGEAMRSPSCQSVPGSDLSKRNLSGLENYQSKQYFMSNAGQLTSTKLLGSEQLTLAKGLNALMREKSSEADLVVTNLPDMPPGESAFGYFQLVEAMTEGLMRCILVRGTASEVITAFT